ncbi:hypothetical protein NQ318_009565 [Aromia moschata]|uniref:Uncharacterized protein n=1 Tax=Aromia moschata TaxID=1265417 RepID=A0AAV8Y960_9CUCU|nr:hypothetical protein NQ318_009565 [Aromia moschata]
MGGNRSPWTQEGSNRGVDDTRRAEDYSVRRRAARNREDTRRLKWTFEMNIEVMRTLYIINRCRDEPLAGWRHSLHAEFLRRNPTFNISEQNIVDKKNKSARSYTSKRSSKIDRKYRRKKIFNQDLLPQRRRRLDHREGLMTYTYREADMKNDENDFYNYYPQHSED